MRSFESDPFLTSVALDRRRVPSFDEYPFCIPAIRNLHTLKLHPKVTFLVGDNGTGKSTLMEAIAVVMGFNPEGGSMNFRFSTRDSHSELYEHIIVDKGHGLTKPKDGFFLRAESFFNLATEIEELDKIKSGAPKIINSYGGRSLHEQSHGESFFTLLTKRFKGNGLYILDEPEAALSPSRQMSVLTILHNLVRQHSQFIIITHSPIILAYPDSTIYLFSEDAITPVEYTETEHYTVTRDFLTRRERLLDILLADN